MRTRKLSTRSWVSFRRSCWSSQPFPWWSGIFLIINTFSILVAQRSRELALLRAMGASRRQVNRAVLIEALAVGLVGSTVASASATCSHSACVRCSGSSGWT